MAPNKDKELSTLQRLLGPAPDNAEPTESILQQYPRKAELHCWGMALLFILMQDHSL